MENRLKRSDLRKPSTEEPLRILFSACLTGIKCGYDGTSNGEYPQLYEFLTSPLVKVSQFCPEEFSFGSPREMCDLHGGDGFDVLDGKAKMLSESGIDWTEGILKAASKMLDIAKQENCELAILMDISGACGSTVIYDGNRFGENKKYQMGAGVAAAELMRNGIKVISQRDYADLETLYHLINPSHTIDFNKINHKETDWFINYFNIKTKS